MLLKPKKIKIASSNPKDQYYEGDISNLIGQVFDVVDMNEEGYKIWNEEVEDEYLIYFDEAVIVEADVFD